MQTLIDLARTKGSVVGEVEKAPYDHTIQRRCLDLTAPDLRHCFKSSTFFDREGSNEADR